MRAQTCVNKCIQKVQSMRQYNKRTVTNWLHNFNRIQAHNFALCS